MRLVDAVFARIKELMKEKGTEYRIERTYEFEQQVKPE